MKSPNTPGYNPVTDPNDKSVRGMRLPNTNKAVDSPAAKQSGLLIGNQSVPRLNDKQMHAATGGTPIDRMGNNPAVDSKATRNGHQSAGRQPSTPIGSPYPQQPVRNSQPTPMKESGRVGWVDGKFVTPKY